MIDPIWVQCYYETVKKYDYLDVSFADVPIEYRGSVELVDEYLVDSEPLEESNQQLAGYQITIRPIPCIDSSHESYHMKDKA